MKRSEEKEWDAGRRERGKGGGQPLDELVADLVPDRLDPAGGELRLGGVEPLAVSRHHLDDHAVDAALCHLPSHPPPSSLSPLLRLYASL